MLSHTAVFTRIVRDHMGPAPITVPVATSCGDAVRRMRESRADSVVVIDMHGEPCGVVTEQDVVRRMIFRVDAKTPVTDVMSRPVQAIRDDELLYHAIAKMRRGRLRHMPVVDASGGVVGGLQLHHALAMAAQQMVRQIEVLTHSETVEGMQHTKQAQVEVAKQLCADAVPAPEIQALITRINNDLYRRIVALCLRDMADTGWGQPPVAFDVMVMGSGGRGESFLYPDQDNGFVLEDYADDQHQNIDPWFIELAERMTEALNRVGFEYCKGNVMATNPLWRKSVSQWRSQIRRWVGKGAGMALRLADIFFDFIPVYGEGRLTGELRECVTETARRPFFLREMYKFDEDHEVALGPFNRLLLDKIDGPNKGKLNLKLTGTLPLVGAVRIAALSNGVDSTSTLARINTLFELGELTADEQDYLSGAFRHITNLLFRQQLRDYEAGEKVGNHVAVDALSTRERDMLIDGLREIKKYRNRLRTRLTGDVF